MIYLGTDIVDIDRIRKKISSKGIKFLNRIFTQLEIDYCSSKKDPSIHFSGRFAAKEAVKKVLFSSEILSDKSSALPLKSIEVLPSKVGSPVIFISDIRHSIQKAVGDKRGVSKDFNVEISISHTDDIATATAVLLKIS